MDRRLLLGGGVLTPAVFVTVSLIASFVEPGYSIVDDHLSGLASTAAELRWWMTGAFVLLGAGVGALAVGLRRYGAALSAALAVAAVCVVAVGLFPRSCVEVECAAPSWHDRVHDAASAPAYAALLVVPILVARADGAGPWGRRGLAVVVVVVGLVVALALDPGRAGNGLVQRGIAVVPLLWLAGLALHLGRVENADGDAPRAASAVTLGRSRGCSSAG